MKAITLTLTLVISSCLTFGVGNAYAGDMKNIFDYYAKGSPGTVDTASMRHWTGASFSARTALNEPNLIQLPTISMGGSCKGMDFHASGFGLVTKDELVQMARGIAQGAPGYFFNMAIGAVCSSCLQNINEFMRKLEKFNDIAKNSCERFWDMATNIGASDKEKINAQAEGKGKLLDTWTGAMNSWADGLDEYFPATEPGRGLGGATTANAQAVLNENVVYERIKNAFTSRYTLVAEAGTLSTPELAMSLFGTLIVRVQDGSTEAIDMDEKNPAQNLNPYNLMFGSPTPVHFWKCDGAVSDDANKCLYPAEVPDPEFSGLYEKFHVILVGDIDDGTGGIIGKIRRRENLSEAELEFVKAFRIPYVKIASEVRGKMVEDLGKRFALMLASEHVNRIYNETAYAMRLSLRLQHKNNTVDFKEKVLGYLDDGKLSLEIMNAEVEKKIREIDDTLQTLDSINRLTKVTEYGAR